MKLQRTVGDVARMVGGTVEGSSDARLESLVSPEQAGPQDLAVLFRPAGLARLAPSPGCLLLPADLAIPAGRARCLIRVADAEAALDALVAGCAPPPPPLAAGVHPTAVVEPRAVVAPDAGIGALAFVGDGASIGARTRVWPGAHVGAGARVGADCDVHPRAVIGARCVLGDRVIVHSGAVLGADGFGFRQDAEGRHHKIPQVGNVEVGDDVEIGANTTIDRARFGTTRIGRGTKLDDQVHIGHNSVVGEHCAIAGTSVLAGSVTMGDRVLMAGCSGVVGGLTVEDGARVAAYTLVLKSVAAGEHVAGIPAQPIEGWKREVAALRGLPELLRRVKALEARQEPHDA